MRKLILFSTLFVIAFNIFAQNVTILPNGITPAFHPLIPRLSYSSIIALPSPKVGDLAVDTTYQCMRFFNGAKWVYFLTSENREAPSTVKKMGGMLDDAANSVAVDANGNVFITGYFTSNANFGSFNISPYGGGDIFLVKCNPSGTVLWVRKAGGPSYLDIGNAVAVDNAGNAYITGGFRGTATFEPSNVTITSNSNSNDIYLAKYDTNGSLIWVTSAGGTLTDEAKDVVVDDNGNCFITGRFNGSMTIGSSTVTSAGGSDYFVAKYAAVNGAFSGIIKGGGASDDIGETIVSDNAGIYIAGTFQGKAGFGTDSTISAGGKDIFLVKYDNSLNYSRKFTTGNTGDDYVGDLAYLKKIRRARAGIYNGSILLTGWFSSSSLSFDTTTLSNTFTDGSSDAYIARFSPIFEVDWAKSAGGTGNDVSYGITTDKDGNSYIAGSYTGDALFDNQSLSSNSNTNRKIFYAKYNDSGSLVSVLGPADNTGDSDGSSLAIDNSGILTVVGYFSGSFTLGNISLTSSGARNILQWSILGN
jgi:hypothetical protein